MATFVDLVNEIADDLVRPDLSSQIRNAINGAIQIYDNERWWFNESRSITFNTVADQEFYNSVDNTSLGVLLRVDQVIIGDGTSYKTEALWMHEFDMEQIPKTYTSRPMRYTFYAKTGLRLYPSPNDVYPVRVTGPLGSVALVNDADTNVWTNEGYYLIRAAAKSRLFRDTLRDYEAAQAQNQAEQEEYDSLRKQHNQQARAGVMLATPF